MNIYHEDVIFNQEMKKEVIEYNLKSRSYSFFQQLFSNQRRISSIKHRKLVGIVSLILLEMLLLDVEY